MSDLRPVRRSLRTKWKERFGNFSDRHGRIRPCHITRQKFETLFDHYEDQKPNQHRGEVGRRELLASMVWNTASAVFMMAGGPIVSSDAHIALKIIGGAFLGVLGLSAGCVGISEIKWGIQNINHHNKSDPKLNTRTLNTDVKPDEDFILLYLPKQMRRSDIVNAVLNEQARLQTANSKPRRPLSP